MPQRTVARRRFLAGIDAAQVASAQPAPPTPPTAAKLKLAVGAHHAGFPLKGSVVQLLQSWGHTVKDCGTFSTAPVDFPDISRRVCDEVLSGRADRAILVCGRPKPAEEVLTAFLNARFTSTDPDFQRRVRKLEEMDKR